jgi:hypothetical protein
MAFDDGVIFGVFSGLLVGAFSGLRVNAVDWVPTAGVQRSKARRPHLRRVVRRFRNARLARMVFGQLDSAHGGDE